MLSASIPADKGPKTWTSLSIGYWYPTYTEKSCIKYIKLIKYISGRKPKCRVRYELVGMGCFTAFYSDQLGFSVQLSKDIKTRDFIFKYKVTLNLRDKIPFLFNKCHGQFCVLKFSPD